MLSGAGIGGGVGVGLSMPVLNASGSLDAFPSVGIGNVIAATAARPAMSIKDWAGFVAVFSAGSGGSAVIADVSLAVFSNTPLVTGMGLVDAALSPCRLKGFGFFTGVSVATSVAEAGVTGHQYYLST